MSESLTQALISHQDKIFSLHEDTQHDFLRFVLAHYVKEGVGVLDGSKLPDLITLKYQTPHDAKEVLGEMSAIRELFIGFQKYLYGVEVA